MWLSSSNAPSSCTAPVNLRSGGLQRVLCSSSAIAAAGGMANQAEASGQRQPRAALCHPGRTAAWQAGARWQSPAARCGSAAWPWCACSTSSPPPAGRCGCPGSGTPASACPCAARLHPVGEGDKMTRRAHQYLLTGHCPLAARALAANVNSTCTKNLAGAHRACAGPPGSCSPWVLALPHAARAAGAATGGPASSRRAAL